MSSVAVRRGNNLLFWCPGCDSLHMVDLALWSWDGDDIAPTISPSILTHATVHMCPPSYKHYEICEDPESCPERGHLIIEEGKDGADDVLGHNLKHVAEPPFGNCHAFLRNGQWEFLGDSTHKLAGKTAQMVDLPEWISREF